MCTGVSSCGKDNRILLILLRRCLRLGLAVRDMWRISDRCGLAWSMPTQLHRGPATSPAGALTLRLHPGQENGQPPALVFGRR